MSRAEIDLSHLAGRDILVAESNPLIAFDLAETIARWGARPVPASELGVSDPKVTLSGLAAAVVDLPLVHRGEFELIDRLIGIGVPVMLTAASNLEIASGRFPGLPLLSKPINFPELERWLGSLGGT